MTAQLSRRSFLTALGVGGVVLATPKVLLAEPEPVRRYWQVGAKLGGSAVRVGSRDLTFDPYDKPVFICSEQGFTCRIYSDAFLFQSTTQEQVLMTSILETT